MHIARHPIDKHVIATSYKSYQSLKNDALSLFDEDKTAVRVLSGYFASLFYCSTVTESDVEKRLEWLDLFIEASDAQYKMAVNIGADTRFEFMNATFELSPPRKNYLVTDVGWTEAYMAAIVRQNGNAIDQLATNDLNEIRRQEKANGFEYSFLFAQFLQHLYEKGYDLGNHLLKVSDASLKVPKTSPLYDYMLDIAGPQIDLVTYVLLKDEENFNAKLKTALLSFREYYERQGDQGQVDPSGLVSIPLSAIVVLAKDVGLAIKHTSDYLPSYLTNNR
jgi:hypothetical protein